MNLIVLTGGKATRMANFTADSHIPKILVSLGKETMFDRIMQSSKGHFNNVYLVVSNYHQYYMLSEEAKRKEYDVNIVLYSNTDGTYNTLRNIAAMNNFSNGTLVQWSDIIVSDYELLKMQINDSQRGIQVFTDEVNDHRVLFDGKIFEYTSGGNVPGLFGFKNLNDVFNYEPLKPHRMLNNEIDITEYLNYLSIFLNHRIDKIDTQITDVGDSTKYGNFLRSQDISSRFFNDIKIVKDKVTKTLTDSSKSEVLLKERDFYDVFKYLQGSLIPISYMYTGDSFTMEKINGVTVNSWLNVRDKHRQDSDILEEIFVKVTNGIKAFHKYDIGDYKKVNRYDYYIEYVDTLVKRIESIQHIVPTEGAYFSQHMHSDDTIKIKPFGYLINLIKHYIKDVDIRSKPIHGDPNMSNTMIDINENIKFIDPRGKFGHKQIMGDPLYDIAKVVYGLHGYDNFNLDKEFMMGSSKNKNGLMHFKYPMDLYGYDLELISEFIDKYSSDLYMTTSKHIRILVGIIYMKLAEYTKNNILKSIASYLYGASIIQKELDNGK